MSRRDENEILAELSRLCTLDGYVHAVAYICVRDNFVSYSEKLTTHDIQHLFSSDRLVRTEICTLIGLMVQKPISYALPPPGTLQTYIDRTETVARGTAQCSLPARA